MLTGYQAEIVAFYMDDGPIHRECAHELLDEGAFARADMGFGSVTPLSRYSLDEFDDSYEYAEESVREFEDDHPALARLFGVYRQSYDFEAQARTDEGPNRWRLVDRVAESHPFPPTCSHCGEVIE